MQRKLLIMIASSAPSSLAVTCAEKVTHYFQVGIELRTDFRGEHLWFTRSVMLRLDTSSSILIFKNRYIMMMDNRGRPLKKLY